MLQMISELIDQPIEAIEAGKYLSARIPDVHVSPHVRQQSKIGRCQNKTGQNAQNE